MSEIKVDKISPQSGTELTLGDAADDFLLPNNAELIAQSGSTITIASGATLANAGTATGFGGGKVLQIVSTFTGASSSGSGAIPLDDTIPQAGAGHEVMTLAITPQESDSKLWIQVVVTGCTDNQGDFSLALFQDSTANALACSRAKSGQSYGGDMDTNSLSWVMTSGTTSETTFKVEIGGNGTSTGYFNWQNYNTGGSYASQIYGGVANSGIIIMEIST